jgi:DNA-binding transcriptional ArsR family regulator
MYLTRRKYITDSRLPSGVSEDPFAPDPAEAFDLLGDETRLAILRVLADRQREAPEDPTLPFTELRRRADVDDSGLFNYHLEKLVGRFVRDTGAGYELGYAGRQVVRSPTVERTEVDAGADADGCPVCGADEEDCNRSIHIHLSTPV